MRQLNKLACMLQPARVFSLLFIILYAQATSAVEDVEYLTQAQWNVPRSGPVIVAMPPLRNTLKRYESSPGNRIQIKYAGGDEGTLWAYELRSWLVSLGVSLQDIELLPGAAKSDMLELRVFKSAFNVRQSDAANIHGGKYNPIHE